MTVSAFSLGWFVYMALAVAYIVFTTKYCKDKTEDEKLSFLLKQSIILCVYWVLYKVGIGLDKTYTEFEFWNELPLFPCNTVIWLSVIACKKNSKMIMSYCFYAGAFFATLAMLMPAVGFYDIGFFTARALGYYVTHWFVVIIGIQFATFKLVKICVKNSIIAGLCFLGIAFIMHIINIIMRATVYPDATYYYTFGFEENSILTMVHDMIPINYVYLIPLVAVGIVFFLFETFVINSIGRLSRKCKDCN